MGDEYEPRDLPGFVDPEGQNPRLGNVIASLHPAYSTEDYLQNYFPNPLRGNIAAAVPCDDAHHCQSAPGCSDQRSPCAGGGYCRNRGYHEVCDRCALHQRNDTEEVIKDAVTYRTPQAVINANPLGIQFNRFGFRALLCKDCTRREIVGYQRRIEVDEDGLQDIPLGMQETVNHWPRAYPGGDATRLPSQPGMTPDEIASRRRCWIVQDLCTCIPKLYHSYGVARDPPLPHYRSCHWKRQNQYGHLYRKVLYHRMLAESVAHGPRGIGWASTSLQDMRRRRFTPLACPCGREAEMPAGWGRLAQNNSTADPEVWQQMVTYCLACGGVRVDPNVGDLNSYAYKRLHSTLDTRRSKRNTRYNVIPSNPGYIDLRRVLEVPYEDANFRYRVSG